MVTNYYTSAHMRVKPFRACRLTAAAIPWLPPPYEKVDSVLRYVKIYETYMKY